MKDETRKIPLELISQVGYGLPGSGALGQAGLLWVTMVVWNSLESRMTRGKRKIPLVRLHQMEDICGIFSAVPGNDFRINADAFLLLNCNEL